MVLSFIGLKWPPKKVYIKISIFDILSLRSLGNIQVDSKLNLKI